MGWVEGESLGWHSKTNSKLYRKPLTDIVGKAWNTLQVQDNE